MAAKVEMAEYSNEGPVPEIEISRKKCDRNMPVTGMYNVKNLINIYSLFGALADVHLGQVLDCDQSTMHEIHVRACVYLPMII